MADDSTAAFNVVLDKVSFVSKLPLLSKATADDEDPTPGYMYSEINKLTLESGGYCQALLDFFVERLDKKSYHVKLKVLRIMKYVVENGHPEFRQGLRRQSRGIQLATKYSGPPDPLHGNTPYLLVRSAAQDLSQLLFNVQDEDSEISKPQPVTLKSTGGMGNVGGGKLQGFGNTPHIQKSLGASIMGGIQEFAEKVSDTSNPTFESRSHPTGQYVPVSLPVDIAPQPWEVEEKPTARIKPTTKTPASTRGHRPGVAGGGWDDMEDDMETLKKPITKGTETGSANVPLLESSSRTSSKSNKSLNDSDVSLRSDTGNLKPEQSTAEQDLVEEFVITSTCLLATRTQINEFLKRCSSLNCERVVSCLNEILDPSKQDCVMLSLMYLEAFLRVQEISLDQLAHICHKNLIQLYRSEISSTQVKAKTRKIIRQLERLISDKTLFNGVPPKYTPEHIDSHTKTLNKSKKSKRKSNKMRLLDSVAVEERNSPELPALNIPFASQSETNTEQSQMGETSEHGEAGKNSKSQNSNFQFLYEQ